MNGHDEARLDAVATLALGALPPNEARELESHIAGCPICRREYDELRGAVDALAFSAEATPQEFAGAQCARVKARVMQAVREHEGRTGVPAAAGRVIDLQARRAAPAWAAYAVAAAALIVAAFSTWNYVGVRSQYEADHQRLALLQARLDAQEKAVNDARAQLALEQSRLADMIAPGAVRYPVESGVVVRSGARILIALRHLPKPPPGKIYQAWTLRRGAKTVSPSITFSPDPTGLALIELPERAADVTAVAISIEPLGGSKAPTSKPAFVRSLS